MQVRCILGESASELVIRLGLIGKYSFRAMTLCNIPNIVMYYVGRHPGAVIKRSQLQYQSVWSSERTTHMSVD
jgi:hypothetical protein